MHKILFKVKNFPKFFVDENFMISTCRQNWIFKSVVDEKFLPVYLQKLLHF